MVTVHGNYVQFRFFRPWARRVELVGDFNGWRQGELQMVSNGDGYWLAAMQLPQGSYKFRYWVDGQWFTDYAAFGIEYGPLGVDSIVRVTEDSPDVASQRKRAEAMDALLLPPTKVGLQADKASSAAPVNPEEQAA